MINARIYTRFSQVAEGFWGGIAFANIYEVPKNENPQPAMKSGLGKL